MYCKVSVPSECLVRKQKSHSAFGLLFVQSHRPRADEGSRSILALCTQQRKIGRVDRQQEHELSTTTDEVRIEQGKARAAIFAAATVLPNISSVSGHHGIEVRIPDGKFNFFVETWHTWYGDVDSSGFWTMTMDVLKTDNQGNVLQSDTQTEAFWVRSFYHPVRTPETPIRGSTTTSRGASTALSRV